MYRDIQYNGSDCSLSGTTDNQNTLVFKSVILYEVDGTDYCYFAYQSGNYIYGVLANNSEIGLTVSLYLINNGSVTSPGNIHVDSSTPSDYYSNFKSGNFTLSQRS